MNFRYTSVGQMKENGGFRGFRNYESLHATSVCIFYGLVSRELSASPSHLARLPQRQTPAGL